MPSQALSDIHPFDPAVLENPFEYWRMLRHEAPQIEKEPVGDVVARVLAAVPIHQL